MCANQNFNKRILKFKFVIFLSLFLLSDFVYSQKSSSISITQEFPLSGFTPNTETTITKYPYFVCNVYLVNISYFKNAIIAGNVKQSKYVNKNFTGKLKFISATANISSQNNYSIEYPLFGLECTDGSFKVTTSRAQTLLGYKPIIIGTPAVPKITIKEMGEIKVIPDVAKFIFNGLQDAINSPTKIGSPAGVQYFLSKSFKALDEVLSKNSTIGFSGESSAAIVDFSQLKIQPFSYTAFFLLPKNYSIPDRQRFQICFENDKVSYVAYADSLDKAFDEHPYFVVETGLTNYSGISNDLPSRLFQTIQLNSVKTADLDVARVAVQENRNELSDQQFKSETTLLMYLDELSKINAALQQNPSAEALIMAYDSYYKLAKGIVTKETLTFTVYTDWFQSKVDSVIAASLKKQLTFRSAFDSAIVLTKSPINISNKAKSLNLLKRLYFYTNQFSKFDGN